MRILAKLAFFIIAVFVILSSIFYSANKGWLNTPIKHAFQYYLWTKNINISFTDLNFNNGMLTASNVKFATGEGVGIITDIEAKTSINWSDFALSTKRTPSTMLVFSKNYKQLFEAQLSINLHNHLFGKGKNYELNIENIKFEEGQKIKEGNFYCRCDNQHINCYLDLGESHYISINNPEESSDKIEVKAHKVPFYIYKVINQLLPTNNMLSFFENAIKSGYVEDAKISFNPNKALLDNNLFGMIKIKDLDFLYEEGLPTIKNIDIDGKINGSSIELSVNSAYSSDILISQGIIEMEWRGIEDTVLNITAKGHGSASSLTDFISEYKHNKMRQANIDLKAVKGDVDVNIDIKIPFSPSGKNIYNITADIPDSSLSIFKNSIKLNSAKLSGKFDGDRVVISGNGKVNNFDSDISFIYNIYDSSEFDHKLDVKTYFKIIPKKEDNRDQKVGFITVLNGDAILDLSYINKNSKGSVSINSDLSNLDLYFDKLGIRNAAGKKALLAIDAAFDDIDEGMVDFSIIGEEKLQISGNGQIGNSRFFADIDKIQHMQTDLSATMLLEQNSVNLKLVGKLLDVSSADMIQFLEKERDSGAIVLYLDIEKIKLKNNVWMHGVKANFECDKSRCFSGRLESKIANKPLSVDLSADDLQEKWVIKCQNAGACLGGIGAYNSMKSGSLVVNINTRRKEIRSGQIIPILDGNFTLKRFFLCSTPIVTKFISFISLPGLLDIIRGNDSIAFFDMKGNFSFDNKLLLIKDAMATGPYFNFNVQGNVNVKSRKIDIAGYVTPSLYGVKSVLDIVPLIGSLFTGTKKAGGLMSAPYNIQDHY